MRVITFSRYFPAKHPRKGEETHFVEKIWKCLWDAEPSNYIPFNGYWQRYDEAFPGDGKFHSENNIHSHSPKHHTIRAGNRWKVGDYFSPRVWSGLPYRSKQIEFSPPICISKIWNIRINFWQTSPVLFINEKRKDFNILTTLAKNDGLSQNDFFSWFLIASKKRKQDFVGQILCWSNLVEYE